MSMTGTVTEPEPICRRCGREAVGWPLARPDKCSPKDWAHCLREPEVVIAENNRA